MKKPLYSIIIPTFNSGATIETAIKSILTQTFENFELLIIDGASADDTLSIVEKYAVRDDRITFVSEKDNGVYDAMNKAIARAAGEWLYFLGSDDYLAGNEVLQEVTKEIQETAGAVDFIYGNIISPTFAEKLNIVFSKEKLIEVNICHQAIFYRKNIFEDIGLYNLKYKLAADHEFNLRCYFNDKIKTKHIDVTIAYYHDGGLSSKSYDKVFFKEYPYIIKAITKKEIPIMQLKKYSNSTVHFFYLVLKRMLYISD